MNLPMDIPVPLESLTERELHRLPSGAIEHDGMSIAQRTRPPLTVTYALVSVQHWRKGLSAAGEYTPYCQRAILLPAEAESLDDRPGSQR